MKINIALFFLFTFLILSLEGQNFGLSLDIAYHHGIQSKNQNDAPFESTTSYSLGSGISRSLMFHIFPDSSNWGISSGFQNMSGNGILTARNKSISSSYEQTQSIYFNTLRWINALNYNFNVKRIVIQMSAGIIIPIINSAKEVTYLRDTLNAGKSNSNIKYYSTLGFTGGVGVSTAIASGVQLFCKGRVDILSSKVKSRIVNSYSDSKGQSLTDVYPDIAQREFEYRKDVSLIRNTDFLPNGFNKNQATDKLTYIQSLSSIGIQMGFLFLF